MEDTLKYLSDTIDIVAEYAVHENNIPYEVAEKIEMRLNTVYAKILRLNHFGERTYAIKPCPFCGAIPHLEKKPLWQTYNSGTTHGYYGCFEYVIKCHNPECGCSVKLPNSDTIYNKDEEAKQNAINAWNRRVKEE